MSSSLQSLLRSLGSTKVRQLPGWALQNISKDRITTILGEAATSYGKKYFDKGKGTPVVHVMLGLGVLDGSHIQPGDAPCAVRHAGQ